MPLKLVARAKARKGRFERLATKGVVYAQQNNVPMCSIDHFGLVAAPALPLPVTLETPSTPIEVPHGYSATIPVKVVRTKGADAALAITALPLPAGPGRAESQHRRESRRGQSHGDRRGGGTPGNVDHRAPGQGKARRRGPRSRPARRDAHRRAARLARARGQASSRSSRARRSSSRERSSARGRSTPP